MLCVIAVITGSLNKHLRPNLEIKGNDVSTSVHEFHFQAEKCRHFH